MKIAHIVCSYPPYYGGMGNTVFQMASELVTRGHEVEVLTPNYHEEKEIRSQEVEPAEMHSDELQKQIDYAKRLEPSFQYGNAARLPQIQRELDEFDIVHLHYPFFGTANIVRKWKLKNPKTPLFITYHMDTRGSGWKGLLFKYYGKYWMPKILNSADCIIASSFDYLKHSDAAFHYKNNPSKWRELPFGVDTQRFSPADKPDEPFIELQLDKNIPTILFVGGMDKAHYFKAIPILLQAMSLLKNENFDLQLILVGDGDLREHYEFQMKSLDLADRVKFCGRINDHMLPWYYNMADCTVLPSIHQAEAFGMVLLESMASGVPVIASDLPGVRSVAKDAGVVVPPRRSDLLAQAIKTMINDPHLAQKKKDARQIAEAKYSWSPLVAQLESWYNDLVSKK